jgi:S-DNA-T family DNA segregation ATPase FtsK/SpoIIIE
MTNPAEPARPRTTELRDALRRLLEACAWRADTERDTLSARDAALARVQREHNERADALARAFDEATSAAEHDHGARRTAASSGANDRLSRSRLLAQAELSQIKERAELDKASAKKRFQEDSWMAETLYDSSLAKQREAFELLRKDVEAKREVLTDRRGEGDATMMRLAGMTDRSRPSWMQPPAAPASTAPSTPSDAAPPSTASQELASYESWQNEASVALAGIGRQWLATLFVMPLPWFYGPIVGVGAGALAWWLREGVWGTPIIIAAIAGLLLALAGSLWMWRWTRQSLIHRARPLYAALNEADRALTRTLEAAARDRAHDEAKAEARMRKVVGAARASYDESKVELQSAVQTKLQRINERAAAEERDIKAARDAELKAIDAERVERLDGARQTHEWESQQAGASLSALTSEAHAAFDRSRAELIARWRRDADSALQTLRAARAWADARFPTWTSGAFDEHNPGANGSTTRPDAPAWTPNRDNPMSVPVGSVRVDLRTVPGGLSDDPDLALGDDPVQQIPALLEFPDRCSALIQAGSDARSAAKADAASVNAARSAGLSALQGIMLRLLASLPPGKARFTIIDPVGLGQSFAAFMHLADHDPQLVSDRIWTEPRHIEQKLTDLTEHMENVIQKYLRNQFASIEDYNAQAGEIAEPYRFLVIADFPANINDESAKRLASILSSGPRCGVYTLILQDPRSPLPQGIHANDLKAAPLRLSWRRDAATATPAPTAHPTDASAPPTPTARLVWDDPDFGPWALTTERLPDDEALVRRVLTRVGRASKDSSRVEVPFAAIAPTETQRWSRSSASEVRVELGKCGATKLQELVLGRGTAQHALIAGRTGSGKSTLLHAIITNTALWYSPDEVELYLIDFKKGVEFKTYASEDLAHARVIAIESEREFGVSVLRRLDTELRRRGELYRAAEVQDLKGYRAARPSEAMPRTLLIIDEFQELFVEDDKLAGEASLLLDRLVRQGRAFGMHVILGSQTLGGAYSLARATIGQMAVRIALQCSEADALLIMSDDNTAPRLLSRPGEAIYNDASGAIEGNSPFQVCWLPDEQREGYLRSLHDRVEQSRSALLASPTPAIVFEGNIPADLARNAELAALLDADAWPAPRPSATPGAPALPVVGRAWLGDPVAIKEPTCAVFRRQASAHMLVVGQRDEAALAMMASSLLSLGAQHEPGPAGARFFVLDGTPSDSPQAGLLAQVAGALPHDARVVAYRDVPEAMHELGTELARRLEADQTDAPPIYILVHALQRFRQLRRAENEFDFSADADDASAQLKPEKVLASILRDGSHVGLHVLAWCDTVASLTRALDRNALREFDSRVLFQMSSADSSALIDAPVAGVIGQNRALFYSEELGAIEKFRPYAMPTPELLARISARLRSRPVVGSAHT